MRNQLLVEVCISFTSRLCDIIDSSIIPNMTDAKMAQINKQNM